MEQYFATMFEDMRNKRSLKTKLSLTDPDLIKQSKFSDHEINKLKNLSLVILLRQRNLKEYVAASLIEWYFLFNK